MVTDCEVKRGPGSLLWHLDIRPNAFNIEVSRASVLGSACHRYRGRLVIREEIVRESGTVLVEVDALTDGAFYPVTGSPVADEISYAVEGSSIAGSGRRAGIDSLRETIDFSVPDRMALDLVLIMNGREITLGIACFRRQQ